jgi:hypothetical protein
MGDVTFLKLIYVHVPLDLKKFAAKLHPQVEINVHVMQKQN